MTATPDVTVLGSMNLDIAVTVPRLPGPGATVLGTAARFASGGKGGNQAVAAARLGGRVRMAGCVGDDEFGTRLLAALQRESVGTAAVRRVPGVASGLALITVDPSGENMITVAPGANQETGAAEVTAVRDRPGDVLVLSAEIPVPVIEAALALRRDRTAATVLNLAPAPPEAARLLAGGVDWLVVNETEAAAILGRPVTGRAEARVAAADLTRLGATHAVITLGAQGAAFAGPPDAGRPLTGPADADRAGTGPGDTGRADAGPDDTGRADAGPDDTGRAFAGPPDAGRPLTGPADAGRAGTGPGDTGRADTGPDDTGRADAGRADTGPGGTGPDGTGEVPGFPVHAVDSVGAGDTFVGALAVALGTGAPPAAAVRAACAAAAVAATRPGTQEAMPRPADVFRHTGLVWPPRPT